MSKFEPADIAKAIAAVAVTGGVGGAAYQFDFRYALASDVVRVEAALEDKADRGDIQEVLELIERSALRELQRNAAVLRQNPSRTALEEYRLNELEDAIDESKERLRKL